MNKIKNFFFKNTSDKQMVVKNTVWLFVGEIIGRLFKLVIVVFATRKLGVEGWGLFSYALAFVSFFYILGDLGINTFTTREMSQDRQDKRKHIGASFILKISLLFFLFILSLIIGPHIGKIKLGFDLLITLSVLFLSDCTREFALSIIRSVGKMEQEAFSKVLMNFIITILGIILIIKHPDALSLAIAYAVGSAAATLFVVWAIRSDLKKFEWKVSKESLKIIYAFSWPIIIISSFSFVFNIDTIMLGQLRSATDVGWYAAAQRVVQFIAIIPAFIATAAFPILSKHELDNEKVNSIVERILVMMFALGIPLAVGGLLLDTSLMSFMFGIGYAPGGVTFGILMISLLASFPNAILTNVIFSKNLQRSFIIATTVGVVVNIILNLILIPRYGAVGAAISVVTTQMLITAINWQKLKKILSFNVIPKLGIILISSIAMAGLILFLKKLNIHILVIVALATITYGALIYFLEEPSLNELLSFFARR